MNKMKKYLIVCCIFFYCCFLNAQEFLSPLNYNPAVKDSHKQLVNKHKRPVLRDTPLNLPFFDDFSDFLDSPYPKQSLWADKYVFINTTYCSNPPSIGVATFDALDNNGRLYTNASTMTTFPADTLTSRSINLSIHNPGDSIYLSFFYQPQGLGPAPNDSDLFILQLYSPLLKIWKTDWYALGTIKQPFKLVMRPIVDTSFFHDGFRFRFVNFASINNGPSFPGMSGNGDIWNLDYVYMDKNRTQSDTIFRDVAFTNPLSSVLKHYQSMPWLDFKQPLVFQKEMNDTLSFTLKNNDYIQRNIKINFQVKEENSNLNPFAFDITLPLNSGTTKTFGTDFLPEALTSEADSSTVFEIKAFLSTDSFDRKTNDTVISYQRFSNYYAYDDGSAEYGYGGFIANTSVAYKFETETEDSLQAVYLFFNRSLKNENVQKFHIRVWSDKNGLPGDSIGGILDQMPDTDMLGHFKKYFLKNAILAPKTYYIGWQQTNETYLNVGFDRNNSAIQHLFINTDDGTGWQKSKISKPGAIMMRPIVGSRQGALVNVSRLSGDKLKIYPNPATGFVHIEIPNEISGSKRVTLFYDITGKLALNCQSTDQNINISSLKQGLYLVRIQSSSGQVFNAKLVKTTPQ
jgi:hypothetical protein